MFHTCLFRIRNKVRHIQIIHCICGREHVSVRYNIQGRTATKDNVVVSEDWYACSCRYACSCTCRVRLFEISRLPACRERTLMPSNNTHTLQSYRKLEMKIIHNFKHQPKTCGDGAPQEPAARCETVKKINS